MKSIVIYDSAFGNTKKIADAIYSGLPDDAEIVQVGDMGRVKIKDFDLIIVGSPTQGGRPTAAISNFIKDLPENALKGVKIAAFDTRFTNRDHGIFLNTLMKVIGFAAAKISRELVRKGGTLIEEPQGFIVHDTEGPLRVAEKERAKLWGSEIAGMVGI